ncbi:MAG TPA: hypothetical protein DDW34_02050 [Clostridium sp.]|nr:hypothetical protein [Clostridium sp.]
MAYATYEYYTNEYYGKMAENDFNRLSRQTTAYLNQITCGRIDATMATSSAVKDACCAVADAYLLNEQGGGIASESNDGISVSYISGTNNTKTDGQRLYEAAALFLGHTGFLYRGVD